MRRYRIYDPHHQQSGGKQGLQDHPPLRSRALHQHINGSQDPPSQSSSQLALEPSSSSRSASPSSSKMCSRCRTVISPRDVHRTCEACRKASAKRHKLNRAQNSDLAASLPPGFYICSKCGRKILEDKFKTCRLCREVGRRNTRWWRAGMATERPRGADGELNMRVVEKPHEEHVTIVRYPFADILSLVWISLFLQAILVSKFALPPHKDNALN